MYAAILVLSTSHAIYLLFTISPSSLESILISRFLLNLRHADAPEDSIQLEASRFSVPVNFRVPTMQSIMGNMGEPLEHGGHEDADDLAMAGEDTGAGPSGVQQWEDGGVQEVRRYRPRLHLELSLHRSQASCGTEV